MRIGIVSLYGLNNYGNALQRRAVYDLITALGHEPVILDTRPFSKPLIKDMIGTALRKISNNSSKTLRLNNFIDFDSDIACKRFRTKKSLERCNDGFDAFVVGSDQVWNPEMWEFDPFIYFLRFADKEKRVALSPSLALAEIPANSEQIFREGLGGFARLSCREDAGAAAIEKIVNREVEVLCDPTMAFPWSYWSNLGNGDMTPDYPYVLVYALGAPDVAMQKALSIANDSNLKIVQMNNPANTFYSAGPAQFISLIESARIVVTDSFHAAAFSIMAETNLVIIERRSKGGSMQSRLDTLKRLFSCDFEEPCSYFDWDGMRVTRKRLADVLRKYLSEELERARRASFD